MKTISKCYNTHGKLIAIIENEAISAITLHSKGIYIYWSKYYSYDKSDPEFEVRRERAGHIICDYTITEILTEEQFSYLSTAYKEVPVIESDYDVHDDSERYTSTNGGTYLEIIEIQ